MKSKAMAVLAAVMMIGIAFGAMSVQTDGATAKHLGEAVVSAEVPTKKLAFTTNEGEFKGYKYEVKFYAVEWNGSDDVGGLTYGTEVGTTKVENVGDTPEYTKGTSKQVPSTDSKLEVSVEYGEKVGTYLMEVKHINQFTEQKVALKAEITVKIGLAVNPVYQTYYTVTVKDGSVATMTIEAMTDVEGGKFYSKQVSVTDPSITITQFKWYAYDLPAGLSMSDSGWVSGIYIGNVDVNNKEVKVVAVSDSATYQGTMKVSCTAYVAPQALTVKVTDISTTTSAEIADGSSLARAVGEVMKFEVKVERGGATASGVTVDVVAVSTDGTVAKLSESGGSYTAPTTGTGAYKVVVTASDGVKEATSSFYLYVLPSYGNVEAQIIPGST